MKNEDIEDVKERLFELSQLEGTELGEMWFSLTRLHDYQAYLPDTLVMALEEEIRMQGEWAKEHTRLIEKTVTETRTITELVVDE